MLRCNCFGMNTNKLIRMVINTVAFAQEVVVFSLIKSFSWAEIIREASSKEAGLDPVVIYDLLKSFPKKELSAIKWIGQGPNENLIRGDLSIMADEIFEGMENSLAVNERKS